MFPDHLVISKVKAPDLERLREVSIKTFSETYEAVNTPENFADYIGRHFNKVQLNFEIQNPDSISYLVYFRNELAGYMKLNSGKAQTEKVQENCIEIERIYVLKKFHGQKIGKALLDTAIKKASELKKDFIWLGVWERNERAIRFYKENGFVQFGTHIFKLGDDDQNDYLFKLTI